MSALPTPVDTLRNFSLLSSRPTRDPFRRVSFARDPDPVRPDNPDHSLLFLLALPTSASSAGSTTGPPRQASLAVAADTALRAERISEGTLNKFVESLGWQHMSDVRAPAIAFPRKRAREISRPRGDFGAEAKLVGASARPHSRDRSGGVAAPSRQF